MLSMDTLTPLLVGTLVIYVQIAAVPSLYAGYIDSTYISEETIDEPPLYTNEGWFSRGGDQV